MASDCKYILDRSSALQAFSKNDLDLLNSVLIIKSIFDSTRCGLARDFVGAFVKNHKPNEGQDHGDGNWYYLANQENEIHFYNCTFNALKHLPSQDLRNLYAGMFEFHELSNQLGLKSLEARDRDCRFNPLVFFYPAGSGKFRWHLHDSTFQKFQVIANLTRPGIDYRGGETTVRMRNGTQVELGSDFAEGDIAIFPYDLWHRVNAVEPVNSNSSLGRMTAILPFVPTTGLKTFYNFNFPEN